MASECRFRGCPGERVGQSCFYTCATLLLSTQFQPALGNMLGRRGLFWSSQGSPSQRAVEDEAVHEAAERQGQAAGRWQNL
jgi:hypothetical protein